MKNELKLMNRGIWIIVFILLTPTLWAVTVGTGIGIGNFYEKQIALPRRKQEAQKEFEQYLEDKEAQANALRVEQDTEEGLTIIHYQGKRAYLDSYETSTLLWINTARDLTEGKITKEQATKGLLEEDGSNKLQVENFIKLFDAK